jgi:hypothetical protein
MGNYSGGSAGQLPSPCCSAGQSGFLLSRWRSRVGMTNLLGEFQGYEFGELGACVGDGA